MISHTYQILSLRKYNDTLLDIVNSFKLRITGTKDGKSVYVDKEILLDIPHEESFIEYENLNEQHLIDWFKDGVRDFLAEEEIQQKFNLNKGTETDSFPWV